MLMLTRKVGESVVIDDVITVTLVEICSGGQVRLGIQAPDDVDIWRGEIYVEEPGSA